MSALDCEELYFLRDSAGGLAAYQEKDASWAGLLAFSSEEQARKFCGESGAEPREVVALPISDRASVAALIAQVKTRAIRYLLLDLDYRRGCCIQVEFDGDQLGEAKQRQFVAPAAG